MVDFRFGNQQRLLWVTPKNEGVPIEKKTRERQNQQLVYYSKLKPKQKGDEKPKYLATVQGLGIKA